MRDSTGCLSDASVRYRLSYCHGQSVSSTTLAWLSVDAELCHGGALVELMTLNRRVVGSIPALAAT